MNTSITTSHFKLRKQESKFSQLLQEIKALTKRLFLQLIRRPSTLVAGILQPLIWLVLFGALFQNDLSVTVPTVERKLSSYKAVNI